MKHPISLLAVAALSFQAHALDSQTKPPEGKDESKKKQAVILGLGTGLYLPMDGGVRRALNTTQLQFPLPAPMNTQRFADRSFRFNFNLINGTNGDNRLFVPTFLYGYEVRLPSKDQEKFLPYFRADAGVAYMDYALTIDGARVAARRLGPAGALEIGANFGSSFRANVIYNLYQRYDGINLSGFTIGVQFRIAKF